MSKHLRMEEKIKNFDRGIEQMMNESSVAPPFGMWNRIAADLDAAEALPVAAAAPASLVSKRVTYGILTVAALISTSFLTALYINSTHQATLTEPVANTTSVVAEKVAAHPPIVTGIAKATDENRTAMTVAPVNTKRISSNIVNPVIVAEEPVIGNKTTIVTDVAVPTLTGNTSSIATDAYYFPPVDMNSLTAEKQTHESTTSLAEEKPLEKKTKSVSTSSSSSNDKRISIKKRKRGGFSYGSLNRTKKQRPKY